MDGSILRCATGLMVLLLLLGGCGRKGEKVESGGAEEEERVGGHRFHPADGELPVGWTSVTHFTMEGRDTPMVVKIGDQALEGKSTTVTEKRTMLQVLGKDKQRLTIQLHHDTTEVTVGGVAVPPKTQTGILIGERIILQKTDGAWTARFESGRKASEDEQRELSDLVEGLNKSEGEKDEIRHVGDEWVENAGGFGEGTINYRLDRLESYQGQECAVLLGTIKATEELPNGGRAAIEGSVRTFHSLDRFGTLYSEVIGTMEVTSHPEVGRTVTMQGPVKFTETSVITVPEFH